MYNEGISKAGDILTWQPVWKLLKNATSFYSYKEQRIVSSLKLLKPSLNQNPDLMKEIETAVRSLGVMENLDGSFDVESEGDENDNY